jgi:hypothetical protein
MRLRVKLRKRKDAGSGLAAIDRESFETDAVGEPLLAGHGEGPA